MQWSGVAFSGAVVPSEQKPTCHDPVIAPGKEEGVGFGYSLLPAQVENV